MAGRRNHAHTRPVSAHPLRILFVGQTWRGAFAAGPYRALRRLGHTVCAVDEWDYVPVRWRSPARRAARRALMPLFVRRLGEAIVSAAEAFRPELVLVIKGQYCDPGALWRLREMSVPCVNYYPDVSVFTHGPYLPRTLGLYDWIFTTKSFGPADLRRSLGIRRASFLPQGFCPELHRRVRLSPRDRRRCVCDVSFVGMWSPKKEATLAALFERRRDLDVRIWGPRWDRTRHPGLRRWVQGRGVYAEEYVRTLCGARVNLALLSEPVRGASSGDRTTSRSYEIPACGGVMVHERTEEVRALFEEGPEMACFDSADELADWIDFLLANGRAAGRMGHAAAARSHRSGYSYDARMGQALAWCRSNLLSRR